MLRLRQPMSQDLDRIHQTMPENQGRRDNEQVKDLVACSVNGEAFKVLLRKLCDLSTNGG